MECGTLKSDQFLDDKITLLRYETDGHCGLHTHDFTEIVYVASGRGIHIIEGEQDAIEKGDLFILDVGVAHEYRADPGTPLIVYNCIFHPFSVNEAFDGCEDFVNVAYHYLFHSFFTENDPKDYIKLTGKKSKQIRQIFEDMYLEYQAKQEGYMQALQSQLIRLLIIAFRLYRADSRQTQSSPVLKKLVVESTLKYLREHFDEEIKCEKLALRSYLSMSYFNKIFREETGMTVIQMLQKIRVENACDLLKNTSLPIMEIAGRVGYTDMKYFYKIFHQTKSLTPGAYRKIK